MSSRTATVFKVAGLVLLLLLLVGLSAAAIWWKPAEATQSANDNKSTSVKLVRGSADTLEIPHDVMTALGVKVEVARAAIEPRRLVFPGSLGPNTDRLLSVKPRFAGEIIELGHSSDTGTANPTTFHPVQTGDQVHEGQLLAVVWSKDLGLQKSQLVDALSKLHLDQESLDNAEKLYNMQALPDRTFRQIQRDVQSDRIAVSAAERTLRSWRLNDKEIQAIYTEANQVIARMQKNGMKRDPNLEKNWARVEVRAPFDGVVLEKDIGPGAIVDTTTTLFIIGDQRRLSAVAYPYEEDLSLLLSLPKPIHWTIRLKADPDAKPLKGTVTEIRPLIDPAMHTGLVKGLVDNPEGRLVVGQYVTATIEVPPARDEVEFPTSALIEDGQESIVFIQTNADSSRFVLRKVVVVRRGRDLVWVRARLTPNQEQLGLSPVRPGDRLVVAGALEMKAAISDLQDSKKDEAN